MLKPRIRKIVGLAGIMGLLLLLFLPTAHAFEGRGGDTVVIGPDEVIEDDLYVGANIFILEGTVKGDVIVGGNKIEINGTVEGDLMAGGQSVTIRGSVTDDVRVAAFAIMLLDEAHIGDDALISGFSLEASPGSIIGGDLTVASAQALLAGEIQEDLLAGVGGLALHGHVAGNVEAKVGEPGEEMAFNPFMFIPDMPAVPTIPSGLSIAEDAYIGGNLTYTSQAEFEIPPGVVAGEIQHNLPMVPAPEETQPPTPTEIALDYARNFAALLLVGLAFWVITPTWLKQAAEVLRSRPFASLGVGILSLPATIVVGLAILLAMILFAVVLNLVTLDNLIGLVIAVGLFDITALAVFFGVAWAYLAKIVVGFLVGWVLLATLARRPVESVFWPLALGLILFVALTAIPQAGGVINLVLVLFGLGALVLAAYEIWQRRSAGPELGEV